MVFRSTGNNDWYVYRISSGDNNLPYETEYNLEKLLNFIIEYEGLEIFIERLKDEEKIKEIVLYLYYIWKKII